MPYILRSLFDDLILAIPAAIIAAAVCWFVRRGIHKKRLGSDFKDARKRAVWNEIIRALFVFWAALVIGGTLLPSRLELEWHSRNRLWKFSDFFTAPYFGNFLQLRVDAAHSGVNILMFVPIGAALPFVLKKGGFGRVVLTGLCMSAAIELLQAFIRRESSLDDIICNTLGAAAGYGLYRLVRLIFPKFAEKCAARAISD